MNPSPAARTTKGPRPPQVWTRSPHSPKAAFTLVEMLVVIFLVSVLATIALPMLRETIRSEKATRTARQVVTALELARSRAVGSSQPVGLVLFRRGPNDPTSRCHAMDLRLTTSVPTYQGESSSAKALLYHDSTPGVPLGRIPDVANAALLNPIENTLLLQTANRAAEANTPQTAFRRGNEMRLGDSGRRLKIFDISRFRRHSATDPPDDFDGWIKINFDSRGRSDAGGNVVSEFPDSLLTLPETVSMEVDGSSVDVAQSRLSSYQIIRDTTPSAAPMIRLPRGYTLDLNFSGIGIGGTQFAPRAIDPSQANAQPSVDFRSVQILFASDGRLETVSHGRFTGGQVVLFAQRPTGLIFLCVGKVEGVFAQTHRWFSHQNDQLSNLRDPESVWIVINPFNGHVSTAPMASINPPDRTLSPQRQLEVAVRQARRLAVSNRTPAG